MAQDTDKATARPWTQAINPRFVADAEGDIVCKAYTPEAAALIVRAVNAHDELVAALGAIEASMRDPNGGLLDAFTWVNSQAAADAFATGRALLAKVRA